MRGYRRATRYQKLNHLFHVNHYPQKIHVKLNIQVGNIQSIFLDELPAWLHFIAHEAGKQAIGIGRVQNLDLQQ